MNTENMSKTNCFKKEQENIPQFYSASDQNKHIGRNLFQKKRKKKLAAKHN